MQICVIRGLVFIRGLLCVFVANHFAAGKYIFGHKKGLFEASIPVLPSFLPSFPAIFLFAFGKYYFAGKTERAGSKKKKINPLKCIRKLNPSGNLLVAVEQHFLCLQSLFIIDISPDQVAQVQAGGGSGFLDDAVVFVILKHNIRQ